MEEVKITSGAGEVGMSFDDVFGFMVLLAFILLVVTIGFIVISQENERNEMLDIKDQCESFKDQCNKYECFIDHAEHFDEVFISNQIQLLRHYCGDR